MSVDKDDLEYVSFIKELISGHHLEGAALGIARQAVTEGPHSLSRTQFDVLEAVIQEFSPEKCRTCHNKIPWSERYQARNSKRCLGCIVK